MKAATPPPHPRRSPKGDCKTRHASLLGLKGSGADPRCMLGIVVPPMQRRRLALGPRGVQRGGMRPVGGALGPAAANLEWLLLPIATERRLPGGSRVRKLRAGGVACRCRLQVQVGASRGPRGRAKPGALGKPTWYLQSGFLLARGSGRPPAFLSFPIVVPISQMGPLLQTFPQPPSFPSPPAGLHGSVKWVHAPGRGACQLLS